MIKNYLSHFLPVLLALDLIIPFLLAPFYKDYNHLTQVMSVLGNSKAPLHSIYNIWLVAFGVAILISTLQLYPTVAQVSSCRTSIKFYIHNAFFRHCDLRRRRLYSFRDFFSWRNQKP